MGGIERIDWVARARAMGPTIAAAVHSFFASEPNRELIERVAEDPIGSVDLWRGAKDPFSFVAACMELSAAWCDPNFITRFPVLLDVFNGGKDLVE